MTGVFCPTTVMVTSRAIRSEFFRASTTTVWVPSNVGVPEMAPVVEFNVSPAGSDLALKATPAALAERFPVKGWPSVALKEALPVNASDGVRARRMPVRESNQLLGSSN